MLEEKKNLQIKKKFSLGDVCQKVINVAGEFPTHVVF